MDRRDFLRNGIVIAAGAGVAWRYGGAIAWSQVRWEDEKESVPLEDSEDYELSPMREFTQGGLPNIRNDWPVIALDAAGVVWIAYVRHERGEGERVFLRSFSGNQFGEDIRLDESPGFADRPRIVAHGGGVAVVWAERHGTDDWRLVLRTFENGIAGTPTVVSQGSDGINWKPAIASDGRGRLVIAWEHRAPGGRFRVVAREISNGQLSGIREVSQSNDRDCSRPDVAIDSGGRAWIAWDQLDAPGCLNVYLNTLTGSPSEIVRVTRHPAADLAPSLAIDSRDRVWIGWHSNRRDADKWDIPRWYYLRCWDGERLLDPASEPRDKNLDKEGTDQSFEFVRIHHAPDGRVVVAGRPSHSFCIQTYGGAEWSPIHRLPIDSWGGRGQFLSLAFGAPGEIWTVRREWGANVLQRITGFAAEPSEPELVPSTEADEVADSLSNIQHAPRRWPAYEDLEGIDEPLHAYFGDLHGHTRMSDGVGDVDEYFYTRRDYYEDDFAALTDHDNFVRLPIFPSGWELQKVFTDHFNDSGRFVTLFAQEHTTARYPTRLGHKCLYHTDRDFPMMENSDPLYNSGEKLADAMRDTGAIMIPHHTGWTGTDWENATDEIQPLVEIVSNHGRFEFPGNEPIPHRGNAQGCFVQDGLARGLKFGLIGGSDAHGLIWHHRAGWKRDCNRTGLAVVLAPELTREAIFDAMRKRRTYATTGNKPRLDFRVNNHLMGEEFDVDSGEVSISVDIAARERVRWVTIVRDNEDLYRYGGEGFTTRFTLRDEIERGSGWHFYYARVEFIGPEMAWSSPIWVRWV